MTLLEAVNLALRSTGESNISALITGHPKHAVIVSEIDKASKQTQRRDWWFNSGIRDLPTIVGGPNAGRVSTTDYDKVVSIRGDQNYYPLGGLLVDGYDGEYVTQAVRAHTRWIYETDEESWAEMPHVFTDYVANLGALSYATNYDADPLQISKLVEAVKLSKVNLNADHTRYSKVNLFRSGSTGVALARNYGQRYGRRY